MRGWKKFKLVFGAARKPKIMQTYQGVLSPYDRFYAEYFEK